MMAAAHTMPGEHVYDGNHYMEFIPPAALDAVKDMVLRDDDIMLVTYPKAGTTWLSQIVCLLHNQGVEINIRTSVPIVEFSKPGGNHNAISCAEMTSPRVLSTHLTPQFFAKSLSNSKPRVLVLMRNPEDCLVSYFHYYRATGALGKFQGTFDEFFQMQSENRLCYGDVIEHVASWWRRYRNDSRFRFLFFEDMKRDPERAIREVANFLQVEKTDEEIHALAETSSFDKMSKDPKVNKESLPPELYDSNVSKYLRKGAVGDWVNYFTPEQNDIIDARCKAELEHLGIFFEYLPQ